MIEAATIVELFARRVCEDGPRPALLAKGKSAFEVRTWFDVAGDMLQARHLLEQLGVRAGDRVAQLSENRYEWIVADLAIQLLHAIHVPIHAPLTSEQITWQINNCGARLLLLSGPAQLAKLLPLADSLSPELQAIAYDRCAALLLGHEVLDWHDSLRGIEQIDPGDIPRHLQMAIADADPDMLTTILYTSGTTGEPKGVQLTQGNLASNATSTVAAFEGDDDEHRGEKLRLTLLPLSHIYARTCDLYAWIAEGSELALAQARETVLADCAAVRPTFINAVPYFYDKLHRALCEQGRENEPGALRELLGGRIRKCCCGGAALPAHLYDYFLSQGVPLLLGYGLSETSPVISLSTAQHHRREAAGTILPGIEVRIADDGEILTRGPHVMLGYYRDPAGTAETIRDGWLHTGDLGKLDDDGYLYITGRKKEILVTLGGKNIAPVHLESLLVQDPLILQALVVGDGRSCLAALIVPNPEVLKAEIAARKIPVVSREQSLAHPQVRELFAERIAAQLRTVASFEQVRHFTLLARGFTVESGELTPKLTLRRPIIEANFAKEIAAMYE
jgi:long-chain acyl-CoA synthetase